MLRRRLVLAGLELGCDFDVGWKNVASSLECLDHSPHKLGYDPQVSHIEIWLLQHVAVDELRSNAPNPEHVNLGLSDVYCEFENILLLAGDLASEIRDVPSQIGVV